MQKRYSEEFKESVIKKMMPPNSVAVSKIAQDTGVSNVTLYKWRNAFRNRGLAVPGDKQNPESWTAADKLAVVIETASMNQAQLGEYCRSKGLYPAQVMQWKDSAISGYQDSRDIEKDKAQSRKEDKTKIKRLESELRRKDKALAETAALLVLSKKLEAIWGESEED